MRRHSWTVTVWALALAGIVIAWTHPGVFILAPWILVTPLVWHIAAKTRN